MIAAHAHTSVYFTEFLVEDHPAGSLDLLLNHMFKY